MQNIIPGILSDNYDFVQAEIAALAKLEPQPQRIQIDILDGEFMSELTIEPNFLMSMSLFDLEIDLHLMTNEPIDFVSEVVGLSNIKNIIAQVERLHSQSEFIDEVVASHFQPGFSLDLYTPFEEIRPEILDQLKVVQIMGGKAGSQGQEFSHQVLEKVQQVAETKELLGLDFEIMVDIGMNPQTIPLVLSAGADKVVVGSYLQKPDRQQAWEELLEAK